MRGLLSAKTPNKSHRGLILRPKYSEEDCLSEIISLLAEAFLPAETVYLPRALEYTVPVAFR